MVNGHRLPGQKILQKLFEPSAPYAHLSFRSSGDGCGLVVLRPSGHRSCSTALWHVCASSTLCFSLFLLPESLCDQPTALTLRAVLSLGSSGVEKTAEVIMRTASLLTMGQYLFLTDHSGVGNAHATPRCDGLAGDHAAAAPTRPKRGLSPVSSNVQIQPFGVSFAPLRPVPATRHRWLWLKGNHSSDTTGLVKVCFTLARTSAATQSGMLTVDPFCPIVQCRERFASSILSAEWRQTNTS